MFTDHVKQRSFSIYICRSSQFLWNSPLWKRKKCTLVMLFLRSKLIILIQERYEFCGMKNRLEPVSDDEENACIRFFMRNSLFYFDWSKFKICQYYMKLVILKAQLLTVISSFIKSNPAERIRIYQKYLRYWILIKYSKFKIN